MKIDRTDLQKSQTSVFEAVINFLDKSGQSFATTAAKIATVFESVVLWGWKTAKQSKGS